MKTERALNCVAVAAGINLGTVLFMALALYFRGLFTEAEFTGYMVQGIVFSFLGNALIMGVILMTYRRKHD